MYKIQLFRFLWANELLWSITVIEIQLVRIICSFSIECIIATGRYTYTVILETGPVNENVFNSYEVEAERVRDDVTQFTTESEWSYAEHVTYGLSSAGPRTVGFSLESTWNGLSKYGDETPEAASDVVDFRIKIGQTIAAVNKNDID